MQNANPVGDIFDHGKVMSNKQISGPGFLLDILHQVDNLGLNGYIQG